MLQLAQLERLLQLEGLLLLAAQPPGLADPQDLHAGRTYLVSCSERNPLADPVQRREVRKATGRY